MDKVLERQWHVVCLSKDLGTEKPLGATIMGQDIVVWRGAGKVLAWEDICIHRGVHLSLGKVCGNRLQCAYHGWTYDENGRVVKIPAHPDIRIPSGAKAKAIYQAVEHIGMVWVNLSDDPADLPALPEHSDPAYRVLPSGPYELDAAAPRVVENFLDIAHVPFVHDGWLAVRERPEINDYRMETTEDGFTATNIVYYQPDPDGRGVPGEYVYDFGILAPLTVYFIKYMKDPSHKYIMVYNVRPVSEKKSVAYMGSIMNYGHETPYEEIFEFQTTIVMQDKPMTESQRPELLPMDLSAELHLKSDRIAIAYRRHLKKIGLSFGTS